MPAVWLQGLRPEVHNIEMLETEIRHDHVHSYAHGLSVHFPGIIIGWAGDEALVT